jgi:hypothetical protein
VDLYAGLNEAMIVDRPFPHIILEGAVPPAACTELVRAFPPLETFGAGLPDAKKVLRRSVHSAGLNEPLRGLVEAQVRPAAFAALARVFGTAVRREYPGLEARFGPLDALRVGQRHAEGNDRCEVLLDAQPVVLAPVTRGVVGERGPHVKGTNKLLEAVLFLPDPADDTPGGEMELFEPVAGHRPRFGARNQTPPRGLRTVRSVPYRAGTLVVWVNTPRSITRLAPRPASPWPVRFLTLPVQLPVPLFELPQEPSSLWRCVSGWLMRRAG